MARFPELLVCLFLANIACLLLTCNNNEPLELLGGNIEITNLSIFVHVYYLIS